MSFQRNNWKEKAGIQESNGWSYLPLNGKRLRKDSTFCSLRFQQEHFRNISIDAPFQIEQGDGTLGSEEFTPDLTDYFINCIRGATIRYARFDLRGQLEIALDQESDLILRINIPDNASYGQHWSYNYSGGNISF